MKRRNVRNEEPKNYIPLNRVLLEDYKEFRQIEFKIKKESHEKSLELLSKSYSEKPKNLPRFLLPSETWGLARVLSNYFGRLNEVLIADAKWEIYGSRQPGESLIASSKLIGLQTKKGLDFAIFETEILDEEEKKIMISVDKVLMLNGVDKKFYDPSMSKRLYQSETNLSYDRSARVFFRFDWNPTNWLKNIHTDKYAQKFGYEKGLPEFITYMDWIFMTQYEQNTNGKMKIETKSVKPLYIGNNIRIVSKKNSENSQRVTFVGEDNRIKLEADVIV